MEFVWVDVDQCAESAIADLTLEDALHLPAEELEKLLKPGPAPPQQIAVSREDAAKLLSISLDSLERYVLPAVKVIQIGRRQVIPVRELERFAASNAAFALR